jgi:hypothetical protein
MFNPRTYNRSIRQAHRTASPWQNGFAAEGENPGRRCSVATILLTIDWLSVLIGALLWRLGAAMARFRGPALPGGLPGRG